MNIMRRFGRITSAVALMMVVGVIAFLPKSAFAGQATGKVVWVDMKNSALLLVCLDKEGCKDIPKSKKGTMFTFVIPKGMKGAAESWQEGSTVKITFQDRDGGGWTLTSVNTM